jgi:hypothetical protein
MAYTPELSQEHSCILRRIAWALDLPMTKTMADIFEYLPSKMDSEKVCAKCRDKTRCEECSFKEANYVN